jgi:large subunit ribosomal protein L10
MPLTKEKKSQVLNEVNDWIKKSNIVIFINFHGLTMELSTKLRALMRGAGARYLVAKKTLIRKVLEQFGFSGEIPELKGEVGMVFGQDEITIPAKSLVKFRKDHPEISILGGIYEKGFIAEGSISKIAALPERDVLIGRFIYMVNAPMRQLVGVLQAPMRDFISVLGQIKK